MTYSTNWLLLKVVFRFPTSDKWLYVSGFNPFVFPGWQAGPTQDGRNRPILLTLCKPAQ
jgi:hypothetical protein